MVLPRRLGSVRSPLKLIISATAASLLLPLTPGTAVADPWGTVPDRNGVPNHPDGWYHWYCMWTQGAWGIPANMQDNADAVINDALGNRTEASVMGESTCDLVEDDGRTDAVFEEIYLEPGVLGETWCHETWSSGECDRFAVVLNQTEINTFAVNDENEYTHTACHELGHSVGLSHYDVPGAPDPPGGVHDCMRSGIWDSGDIAWRTYNPHHVGHINAWFVEQGRRRT